MRRRDFLKAGTAGIASGILFWHAPGTAAAQEKVAGPGSVDPEQMAEAASHHFMDERRTCSESVLLAGCEALGIESDLVPNVALGLAGGIGLRGHACGAVTGAAMVLGLALGPQVPLYAERKKRVLEAASAFCTEFEQKFGSVNCKELTALDLTTAEGREALKTHVKAAKCKGFIETAAKMLAEKLGAA